MAKKLKKEDIFEKSSIIKEAEKQEKGIVKIGFNEETPSYKVSRSHKKTRYKPLKQEIQEKKLPKKVKLSELPDLPDFKETKKMYATNTTNTTHTEETNIEQLEKEIREKKKLLKLKKREEQEKLEEEKLKQIEEERKKIAEEISFLKQEEEIEQREQIQEIELSSMDNEFLKICPNCNSKIKRNKVIQDGFILQQLFKCKKCDFQKEIVLNI